MYCIVEYYESAVINIQPRTRFLMPSIIRPSFPKCESKNWKNTAATMRRRKFPQEPIHSDGSVGLAGYTREDNPI